MALRLMARGLIAAECPPLWLSPNYLFASSFDWYSFKLTMLVLSSINSWLRIEVALLVILLFLLFSLSIDLSNSFFDPFCSFCLSKLEYRRSKDSFLQHPPSMFDAPILWPAWLMEPLCVASVGNFYIGSNSFEIGCEIYLWSY